MVRKNPRDYIPEITKILNENPPLNGYQISEKEVKMVLDYWLKNYVQTIKKYNSEIRLRPFFHSRPAISKVAQKDNKIYWNAKQYFESGTKTMPFPEPK
jgi:hypothetical protein